MRRPSRYQRRKFRRPAAKRYAQNEHAKRAGMQRAGRFFSNRDLDRIAGMMQRGEYKGIYRQGNGKHVRSIEWEDERLYLVWDNASKRVATFLTPEMAQTWDAGTTIQVRGTVANKIRHLLKDPALTTEHIGAAAGVPIEAMHDYLRDDTGGGPVGARLASYLTKHWSGWDD